MEGWPVELERLLAESVERICDVPAGDVRPSTTLDELGIDSLAAAELVTDLEMRSGIELPLDVLRRLNTAKTVDDVLAMLRSAVEDVEPSRE
jgi:acyl carrier protein